MQFLIPTYHPLTVVLSVLIGGFASFVALDLTRHVRSDDPVVARRWLIGGSLTIATGIWSMHFTGMHAFVLPIEIGYGRLLTAASFVAAFAVSVIALSIAGRGKLTARRWLAGSLLMGVGICTMHYTGMAAIDIAPGIVWRWSLVAASALIAVTASAAALFIGSWLPTVSDKHRLWWQMLAAAVMGLAISGMHYTGMAAALFPANAVCITSGTLEGANLNELGIIGSFMLMSCALFTSIVDAHMQRKATILAASLAKANDRLATADDAIRRSETLDPLTKLLNRVAFEERLIDALATAKRTIGTSRELAVLSVDINGLRSINESLGHASGDELIRQVARRVSEQVRNCDSVARFTGDRLVVLMDGIDRADDCVELANRMISSAAEPYNIAGRNVQINVCVGVAVQDDDDREQNLILQSDAAVQAAKRGGGRGTYAFFKAHVHKQQTDEFDLVSDLRQAIELHQFELHYQPKIDSQRHVICGVEALLRWTHPIRGAVSPVDFIPLAERFGLINAIGNWVIETACRQLNEWERAGVHMRVAINVSAQQLRENELVERIASAMERYDINPSQLLCEITESSAMEDLQATQRTLDALGNIGVYLSIDDFGTGYSSLAYLRQLPARQLKIDRSFINDLETSNDARALVDAIVRLSHALGLRVVAEGVETAGQRDILIKLGCDELQGYYFARPMSAAKLLEWTAGKKPKNSVDFSKSLVLDV
jgi:diguanylate cyclase (GGDEF)-like protein